MNVQEIRQTMDANPEFAAHAQQRMDELLARSATDASFRRMLLSDPRAAIAEFTGNEVPEGAEIYFIENDADVTVVLPDPMDLAAELSEAELEAVAGGITPAAALAIIGWLEAGAIVAGSVAATIATIDYFRS